MTVTSIVRDRGRALGVIAALTASVALASAPTTLGAVDGDPINTSTDAFKVKLSGGFKKQLKSNGVKMKPTKLKLTKGDVDPTTGKADLSLGKITFKKGKEKLVYSNLKGSLPGTMKGSSGKLFKLTAAKTVTRKGFGASLSGIKVKFLKVAAKKINKKLELNSLHKGNAGTMRLSYQPQTVKVLSGRVLVDIPMGYLPQLIPIADPAGETGKDPNTVVAKQPSHCISPFGGTPVIPGNPVGGDPNNVARKTTTLEVDPVLGPPPTGMAARLYFPVTGGTVSPTGNDGVIQVSGGVRLQTGSVLLFDALLGTPMPSNCAAETPGEGTSRTYLSTTNLAPNLALQNVQSNALIGGLNPGCNFDTIPPGCPSVLAGDKGIAIGQVIDAAAVSVNADPAAKTVTINGAVIKNNPTSSFVLNGVFPNATSDQSKDFADGDKFGISTLNVNTR